MTVLEALRTRTGLDPATIDDVLLGIVTPVGEQGAVLPRRAMLAAGWDGGAIALGHPLGATGAMLLGTVLDELERRDLRHGLITLCVGAGMGVATIVERLD